VERPRKASVQLWAKQQPFFERPMSVDEVVLELGEALVEDVDVVTLDVVAVVVTLGVVVAVVVTLGVVVAVVAALGGAAPRLLVVLMELRDSMDHDKKMKWMFSFLFSLVCRRSNNDTHMFIEGGLSHRRAVILSILGRL
jgi:hypothetical protein